MADLAKLHGHSDPKKDAEWFEYAQDIAFLVAPAENPAFNMAALKAVKLHPDDSPDKTLYDEAMPNLTIAAEYLLLDWKNLELDGKVLEYSPKAAAELMVQYPSIADFVNVCSVELREKLFGKNTEELKKKSKK